MWAEREQLGFEITRIRISGQNGENSKIKPKNLTPTEDTQWGGQIGTQNRTLPDDMEHFVNVTVMKSAVGNSQKALVRIQIQITVVTENLIFSNRLLFFLEGW